MNNVHDGIDAYLHTVYGMAGHWFGYDVILLVDLFGEGLTEEANLFEGSSKVRAHG